MTSFLPAPRAHLLPPARRSGRLTRRLRTLFGPVAVIDGYGMTETFTAGGQVCSAGHPHFHPAHALVEVHNRETGAPARPGEIGTLVVTPLPPFCETTPLLGLR